jgi:hypothetical protein
MSSYKKMKCFNLMTGEFKGYLSTLRNYVTLVPDKDLGAEVKWSEEGGDMYLVKATSPADRFLGVAERGYAGWGLWGGWRDAVLLNADGTISLKATPERKLYGPYDSLGNEYVCWAERGENNQAILRFVMED